MDRSAGNSAASRCDDMAPPSAPLSLRGDETEQELQMRLLRHENELLRQQLLKLREQERQLLISADCGTVCPAPRSASFVSDVPKVVPQESAVTPDQLTPQQMFCETADGEAAALRTRFLRRKEERQLHVTAVRSQLRYDDPLHRECVEQQQRFKGEQGDANDTATPALPASPPARAPPVQLTEEAAVKLSNVHTVHDETVQRKAFQRSSPQASAVPISLDAPAALDTHTFDDMTAEAILQRYQDRKSQRQLRLEKMLGPGYSAASSRTSDPISGTGGSLTAPQGVMPCSAATGQGNAGVARVTDDNSGTNPHRCYNRAGENAAGTKASTTSPSARPTRNPNQIGRAVSDAVKNNSWYLCKVLEAALLDTIQARPTSETPVPALSAFSVGHHPVDSPSTATSFADSLSSFSPSPDRASQLQAPRSNDRTAGDASSAATPTRGTAPVTLPLDSTVGFPTSVTAPQLLYHKGVNDKALKRAIEESLLLPFRCVQDAPRRLTSSQAAEESLPAFEAENRDAELCRCFAEGYGRKAYAGSGTRREDDVGGSVAAWNDDEAHPENEADMLGAKDENLDPFARLLLARISADLPVKAAKADKRRKPLEQHGSSNDGLTHVTSPVLGASLVPSPTNSKAAVSFVAAAGGDRRVHAPKKHFSRLDEVQVEMHAPVIFSQIRGFLRMDVDRLRGAFAQKPSVSPSSPSPLPPSVSGSGERTSSQLDCALETQQRRLCVGLVSGSDEATVWRISVSPGKSGTTLLYFSDFVMKTVRPSEMEFLLRKFLPAYVRYCERNPHTLLPRFYALATLRWWKAGVVQHFVLMQNVFSTPYYIHRIYDVKGSTVNRTALQPGKSPPRTAFGAFLLKDNDLPSKLIVCGSYQRAIVLAQFRSDVDFLRQLNVVDYSCMIGVRSRLFSRKEGPSKTLLLLRKQSDVGHVDPLFGNQERGGDVPAQGHKGHTGSKLLYVTAETATADGQCTGAGAIEQILPPFSIDGKQRRSEDDVYVCIHGCDGGLLSLPIYTPGDDTTAREDVYYLGIIDVLQTYNSAKKFESFAKGLINDRSAISVIAPDKYAERLYKVLERITT
ncbi:hypothetical protein JKF63_01054 [Porcisia hertigi]|uniref:PIPK domain-containing protein n=1 Tax=Porcisia hertigi TaxID=2761500 RepID=A0A836I8M1_9TRYP|nr:hypothetical protein JKF63_01054 [Porcisia hertigi]